MSKKLNIAGVRFGSLVAVEPTADRRNGYTIWRCLCDCGNVALVSSRSLKSGRAESCGDPACPCRKTVKMRTRGENLVGQRFGKLTVVSRSAEKGSAGQILWNCRCDCGGQVITSTGQLNAGYRKSCGCLSRPPRKDWIGETFGSLTVIAYDGKRGGKHYWKCRCTCGSEVSICQSSLKSGHTTSCGCANKPYAARTIVDGTCLEALRGAVEKKTIARNNSSGVRGVYKSKKTGRWCAQITFQGKTRYLGSYDTLREARLARERGEEMFEEFLNAYEAANTRDTSGTCGSDNSDADANNVPDIDKAGIKSAASLPFVPAPLRTNTPAFDAKLALLKLGAGPQQKPDKTAGTKASPETDPGTVPDDRIAVMV